MSDTIPVNGEVRAASSSRTRNRYPDYSFRHHYHLTDLERDCGSIARSRIFDLLSDNQNAIVGFHEGDNTLGSFLTCGVWNRRAPHGLGLWGLGRRLSGELDCARWHWFRLTMRTTTVPKRDIRRALRRRLLAFPGDLHGFSVARSRNLAAMRASETFYE